MKKRFNSRKRISHGRRISPAEFDQKRRRLDTSNATKTVAVGEDTAFRESLAATANSFSDQDEGLQDLNQNVQAKSWFRHFCFQAVKLVVCLAVGLGFLLYLPPEAETNRSHRHDWGVGVNEISASIEASIRDNLYPNPVKMQVGDDRRDVALHYTINSEFKGYIDGLLEQYGPDFAAVVVADPKTGQILAMSSFIRDGEPFDNLSVHTDFPAASIFKMITAAAALDLDIATPSTVYQYNGKNSSLYKSNVLRHKKNKWTRSADLTKAFALSINTVFGRLGIFDVGGESLGQYANQFGFNRALVTDVALAPSKTNINADDEWSIAEAASGYTRKTTISPLHAVMLASAVVNDGIIIEPRIVDYARIPNGPLVYEANPGKFRAIDQTSAQNMRVLMRETVRHGSARKSFRGFFKRQYANLDVGGKTGSLSGTNPKGRTEWFVGYGDSGSDQITIAAVVVNKEKWRIKPAVLARKVIENYFKSPPAQG